MLEYTSAKQQLNEQHKKYNALNIEKQTDDISASIDHTECDKDRYVNRVANEFRIKGIRSPALTQMQQQT